MLPGSDTAHPRRLEPITQMSRPEDPGPAHLRVNPRAGPKRSGKGFDDISAGWGNDTVILGPDGSWPVLGEAGNDKIYLPKNRSRDVIKCGPGRDVVAIDGARQSNDTFRNCESIR
jgi:hypothetical protein